MVGFKSTALPIFFCLSHLSFVPPFQPSFRMTDKVGKNSGNNTDVSNTINHLDLIEFIEQNIQMHRLPQWSSG